MDIDALLLVVQDEGVVIFSVVYDPAVCGVDLLRRIDFRNEVLHYLDYCGRMNDHEVDVLAIRTCGISTCAIGSGRSVEGDESLESALRNTDESHSIVELDITVYIGIAVLGVANDVALESLVDGRGYEQDSAFIRNFRIVQGCFSVLDSRCKSACKCCGYDLVGVCSGSDLAESVSVLFGDRPYTLMLC